ncbi:hypothetical protein Afil01_18950 [Actinorhabdospora filicis]|uniref:Mycothiol-dependent maleylpyruvate isomerase metal-binding domain-containing protein n=1 Tax=Actinorhabdospora filicis TaxID=1785913 RepID=A0A9W6SIW2_9ACTN|nr:TIGR03086 family metal-binding protein [Actinorhabdospora filicis]GLZ77088.1 hypothetical protein Afil01_18950 [Actinorhabdospora filicis]
MTSTWPIIDRAHASLAAATAGLTEEQKALPTPCAAWSVQHVIEHAAGDQIGLAGAAGSGEKPAYDPFNPPGDQTDLENLVADGNATAAAAYATVAHDAEEVGIPMPPFKAPARLAAALTALDAAIHAWDIQVATGRPVTLTEEDAAELLDQVKDVVDGVRPWGAYAQAGDPVEGDSAVTALLRFLGRDPEWKP